MTNEKDKETRRVVELAPDQRTTWCSPKGGHIMKELELEQVVGKKIRQADCPRCNRRYVSQISENAWSDSQ